MKPAIAIVGAGFSGSILARSLAQTNRFDIVVFEERSHVSGNCHTRRCPETGVMEHVYGPHIFHTSDSLIWDYVNSFGVFRPFINRVKAVTKKGVYSLPINLLTINSFFNQKLNPSEARRFILQLSLSECGTDLSLREPKNFEEQALRMIGRDLYENFFYGYTKKQWGVEPKSLPASILTRLPLRFNYDDNYYSDLYQGIPEDGYTAIVERILDCDKIEIRLNTKFDPEWRRDFDHIFWSGPLDGFFKFSEGRLGYRTLFFEKVVSEGDFQGNPVLNYCEEEVPYTRSTEHKHFAPWEDHSTTLVYREYSALAGEKDTPFYPLRLAEDKGLLDVYLKKAKEEKGVTFTGRLGTYRYLDMHIVIKEALDLAARCLKVPISEWPSF